MSHTTVLPLLKKLPALGAAKGHKAKWILCAALLAYKHAISRRGTPKWVKEVSSAVTDSRV